MSFTTRILIALALIVLSVLCLERARSTVEITSLNVDRTPVTQYAQQNADGPIVIIAHGFAGSQQMMQGYALPLARAGYRVFAFEFLGHGRHPDPMSGDVSAIDGTTRLLMDQTATVIDALSEGRTDIGLIGHSMATDILVRVATDRTDIGPMVLISAFSKAIDGITPSSLLLLTGAWESGLRAFALDAVRQLDPSAQEGQTITADTISRRVIAAPASEHVSILQSRVARREAVMWLDQAYGRTSDVLILPTGWAILGLLSGLVLLFPVVAKRLPSTAQALAPLKRKQVALLCVAPTLIAPLIAVTLNLDSLPVLVADYLAVHLFIFGCIQVLCLRYWRIKFGSVNFPALLLILSYSAVFGYALDRYAANFWPTPERVWIIAALSLGAVPYMLADALIASRASYLQRVASRFSLLISLGIAVALDFEALFFLIMIAPVLVLFYAVFATMGQASAKRSGPLSTGFALGLVLAWALGVSFPLFQT